MKFVLFFWVMFRYGNDMQNVTTTNTFRSVHIQSQFQIECHTIIGSLIAFAFNHNIRI